MISNFPLVKAFARAAEMHHAASGGLLELCKGKSVSLLGTEVIYLCGYVVECALKAYLLSQVSPKQHRVWIEKFKENGHDLDQLLVWLQERRCQLPTSVLVAYRRVRGKWSSQMRYEAKPLKYDVASKVFDSADMLFQWVSGR
jgi:hypothetical protein